MNIIIEFRKLIEIFLGGIKMPWLSEQHMQIELCLFLSKQEGVSNVIPEFPVRVGSKTDYIDVVVEYHGDLVAIELKYKTEVAGNIEYGKLKDIKLKAHGAQDLARASYIKDVARIEKFVMNHEFQFGLFIGISNDPAIWNAAGNTQVQDYDVRFTNENGFSRVLTGHLLKDPGKTFIKEYPSGIILHKSYRFTKDWTKKFKGISGKNEFIGTIVEVS